MDFKKLNLDDFRYESEITNPLDSYIYVSNKSEDDVIEIVIDKRNKDYMFVQIFKKLMLVDSLYICIKDKTIEQFSELVLKAFVEA